MLRRPAADRPARPARGPGGLFWRTFLLIGALILASLLAWSAFFRVFERTPRAQQIAWQITSVINLTRAALVSASPQRREALLADLARDEDVQVDVLEPDDRTGPLPPHGLPREVAAQLRALLGPGTRVAGSVNGTPGFWVSFQIAGDAYWLRFEPRRMARALGPSWIGWALVAIALSLVGALVTSRLVNRPLARLARALDALARGMRPQPLPEAGPREIAQLNARFNGMADALAALDSDRALALAGISHDVRTPLTRLRIEIELAQLPEATRAAMADDIDAIDRIVGQFVDFARGGASEPAGPIQPAQIIDELCRRHEAEIQAGLLRWDDQAVDRTAVWNGRRADFERILSNLVENARRYGRTPDSGALDLRLTLARNAHGVALGVADAGPGVPSAQLQGLTRPFVRLDSARGTPSAAGGSGLGLAIVERLAARYGGSLRLASAPGSGLAAQVDLPDAPASAAGGPPRSAATQRAA